MSEMLGNNLSGFLAFGAISVTCLISNRSSFFLLFPIWMVISGFVLYRRNSAKEIYTLYGLSRSPYTHKVRTYLKNKRIPFVGRDLNGLELGWIKVVPLVSTPERVLLQDSHDIIEFFEKRFPMNNVYPDDALIRFLSVLIAAWADEHWIPATQFYRWTKEVNIDCFRKSLCFPNFVPKFIREKLTKITVEQLLSGLFAVGVREEQYHLIELWTNQIFRQLNLHFEQNKFLFGSCPTIGDYGLIGPIELFFTDPFTCSSFVARYPHVFSWKERMDHFDPTSSDTNLMISVTLYPIIRSIFQEFIPVIDQTVSLVNNLRNNKRFAKGFPNCLPRGLRQDIQTPYIQSPHFLVKYAFPFHLWKFQKVLNEYKSDPELIHDGLRAIEVENLTTFMKLEIPKLCRVGLNVAFD